PDHVHAQEYRKGKTYEVPESLANVFLTDDPPLAVRVGKKDPVPEETKVEEPEETKDKGKEKKGETEAEDTAGK
ncbi:MAG: hypothetical protein JSV16_05925, partial [Candidatus Hydrogenedentota bacterium]